MMETMANQPYTFSLPADYSDAPVTITDTATGATVATGILDVNGRITLTLPRGRYRATGTRGSRTAQATPTAPSYDPPAEGQVMAWNATYGQFEPTDLSATFANVKAGGNRVVALGDSLTQWQDANPSNPGWQRVSWYPFAALLSKQQIRYTKNAGIGGNTTQQMIDRFDTDVTPYKPSVVTILGGRNDPDAATTIANLKTLVAKVRGIGALPVLCTLPPCNTANTHAPDQARNLFIRRYAADQGIPVIDFRGVLVDPANGNYQSGFYNDGTHPNDAGFKAMADAAVTTLGTVLPPYRPHLCTDHTDPANIIYRPLFRDTATQSMAAATRTGSSPWSLAVSSGTRTISQVTGDTNIQGNWFRWVDTAAAGTSRLASQTLDPALLVQGHKYVLTGRIKSTITSFSGSTGIEALIGFSDGSQVRPVSDWMFSITDGIFYAEFTPPAGVTTWEFVLNMGAGNWDVQIAQLGLYDLTALGVE